MKAAKNASAAAKALADKKVGWKTVKLGEVCDVNVDAYSPSEKWPYINYLDTGSVTCNHIQEIQALDPRTDKIPSRARRKARIGSILYSTVRPNQRHYAILKSVPANFLVSTGFAVIDVIPSLSDSTFLYYFLTQDSVVDSLQVVAEQSVSTYPSLNPSDIMNLSIPLPPLPIQRKIAAVLGAIDDKIENNRKICANLEAQAQALFKSWFVDFEPFGGKMPEGWKMGKLGDVAEITSGKRPPTRANEKDCENQYPLLGASCIMGYTSEFMYEEPILVTGRVGTHGVIQRSCEKCWPSDNTLVLKSEYYEFVYQLLLKVDYSLMNRGSTQPLITQSDLKGVAIIKPDETKLKEFEGRASTLMAMRLEKDQESRALAEMRDALLPKLMSGEIDVSEVISA